MRRTLIIVALFACAGLSAQANQTVSVAQLESTVAELKGRPDVDCARRLSALRLSERLGSHRREVLEGSVSGGHCRQALRALADESQFLASPVSEIPAQAAPDFATQRAIMGRVVSYVGKTLPQLPNFIATRSTTRFEDMPQRRADYVSKYEPLHPVGSAAADVSYADGREVVDSGAKAGKGPPAERGLSTWGEFGPVLSTVLLDAARNKLGWLRWEQGDAGPLVVFAYSVPRETSHYEVDYCCVQDSEGRTHTFHALEGYEGEIGVDPATGAILRLILKAQIKAGEPVSRADLVVEYGAVEIGGKSYICPVRSIALSRAQSIGQEQTELVQEKYGLVPVLTGSTADVTQQTLLNESAFTGYHVFRAQARVLTAAEADLPPLAGEQSVSEAIKTTSAAAPPSVAPPANEIPAPMPAEAASTTALPPEPASSASKAAEAPERAARAEPEISATADTEVPELSAGSQTHLRNTGFTLRTTTRLVEVAVVATDKKGRPVTDLKPADLEIYDNGRPETVKDFTQAGADVERPSPEAQQQAQPGEPVVTNRAAAETPAPAKRETRNATVLLIDAAHVAFSDLNYARGEVLRFLKTVPADERVGLYILGVHGFQVMDEPTEDHAALAATLARWMPSAQDLQSAQAEEQRNRQQFDWVHSVYDMAYVNGNGEGGSDPSMHTTGGAAAAAMHPPDAELRPMGDRPEDFALHLLVGVGRHLAAIPGHKTLVWIASDNVLADWTSSMVGREDTGNRFLDSVSLRARETLNEAHVSIYPLDVSQLEGGGITASMANRNVTPIGKSDRDISVAQAVGDASPANKNGRDTARMNEDTHPIQPAFRELAEATGGRALRRSGDIAKELDSIVADGRAAYLLSFTPDTQADGKYHTLTVKCLRKDVTLRFRNGYLYAEEPATMNDRFREAVWQPREESGIGLTATTVSEAKGPAVRLNIAATDLELAQQDGRWTGKVDVFLVARDDSGLHAAVTGKRLGLALTPATYQRDMKDGLTMEESLPKMPPGALLRLIVIDENSGRMGSVTVGEKE